jgi:cytochrome c peroxidase
MVRLPSHSTTSGDHRKPVLSFSPVIFTAYEAWSNLSGGRPDIAARRAIARGEQIFNSIPIEINGVAGINDVLGQTHVQGFCGTCHDTPNAAIIRSKRP